MKLTLKKELAGIDNWEQKVQGVVLVRTESDIQNMFEALFEQDEDWNNYRHLIQVCPESIENEMQLIDMMGYVGKTLIDVEELRLSCLTDFIIFQAHVPTDSPWIIAGI